MRLIPKPRPIPTLFGDFNFFSGSTCAFLAVFEGLIFLIKLRHFRGFRRGRGQRVHLGPFRALKTLNFLIKLRVFRCLDSIFKRERKGRLPTKKKLKWKKAAKGGGKTSSSYYKQRTKFDNPHKNAQNGCRTDY